MSTAAASSAPNDTATKENIRYKTRASFVAPMSARETFADATECFFTVSLDNYQFTPAKVESMARWISGRFSHCTVLVGDGIHRLTLGTKFHLTPARAAMEALKKGADFIEATSDIFDRFRVNTDFVTLRCSEVQTWRSYAANYRELIGYFRTDSKFRRSVEAAAERYHERQSRTQPGMPEHELEVQSSCQYFLEEFAVFACMHQTGRRVMIYPGMVSTLTEIINGEHVDALPELKGLTFISLDLKRR